MPFQYILANLLAETDQAVGVLFLDESGETVDLACADFTPQQIRMVGAYIGIYLRQIGKFLDGRVFGETQFIHIAQEKIHIYAYPLPDHYYLVLIQKCPASVAQARITLAEAGQALQRELFG